VSRTTRSLSAFASVVAPRFSHSAMSSSPNLFDDALAKPARHDQFKISW
jgi:hypothetical protein